MLAVRSSGLSEDSMTGSQAGENLTLFVRPVLQELAEALVRVALSGRNQLGVVVQPMIQAHWSGVAFSLNPLDFSKDELVVEWVQGAGEKLVSGVADPCRVSLPLQESVVAVPTADIAASTFEELRASVSTLGRALDCPVDVEWVIGPNGRLVLVQVRPVVLPPSGEQVLDAPSDFTQLPSIVSSHPKLALRRLAAETGVPMGSACVVVRRLQRELQSSATNAMSRHVAAKSIVLLHPRRLGSKVVREFGALNEGAIEYFTEGCRRYAVRDYPASSRAQESVERVLKLGSERNWVPVVIVQDVLCADATGIARRIGEETLVEIAQGHFVPKGAVETCVFARGTDHAVQPVSIQEQTTAFHFLNGHVISESPIAHRMEYTDTLISTIADTLSPVFRELPESTVEFGVIVRNDRPLVYLIDWAEGDSQTRMPELARMKEGVISAGSARGKVVVVGGDYQSAAMSSHLDDEHSAEPACAGPKVFLCERPSSDLLRFAQTAPLGSGFVFKQASMLCHMAVVLRERGIPAIKIDVELWERAATWERVVLDTAGSVFLTRDDQGEIHARA
jgi:hypothetical protein